MKKNSRSESRRSERRGSWTWHRSLALALMSVSLPMGCTSKGPSAEVSQAQTDSSEQLLLMGRRFASQGQSVRAEQYFLAAIQEGAKRDEVQELLIDTCVRSGRLRSALHYVEFSLRRGVEDSSLRRLAATLYMSLGQRRAALEQAERLSEIEPLSDETLLFLGEFFERYEPRRNKAIAFYRQYLNQVSPASEERWVSSALSVLEADHDRLVQREGGHHE